MKPPPPILIPNFLSFLRILIGAAIPVLLFWPYPEAGWTLWMAIGLFLFGAFTDFWDGWVARRHRLETPFGRVLDPTADKIFILSTMAGFAAKGIYSYWYLVPVFLREIAVTFCRIAWLQQGQAVGAERAGKLKLGLQVTSVLFSFLYLIAPNRLDFYLNFFFLILAVGMTIYSGIFFFLHNRNLLADKRFLRTLAALGVGYLRPVPGTYGSLLGLFVALIVARDFVLHLFILLTFVALAYLAIPRLGLADEEDPLEIVIDEFCGILLAFLGIPIHGWSLLCGFLLFRLFDVTKVFPLHWLEQRKGVHGIMLDDLGAGVYTWLILRIFFQ